MLLHVGRDRRGSRRLAEIAVLRRAPGGEVRAVTAWHADTGIADAADDLRELLRGPR